jgi:ubiquinone/menaquinone biosynthesis C-methylase UbiE
MREHGATVTLVRGIAETLPFPDETFDRVLCDSALDHLADPERGIREMARVTTPGGRIVLTFVNYGSLGVRASRVVYRLGRRLGVLPLETSDTKLFWDSPVPHEHTFECTFDNVRAMCASYLHLERARGIAIGSGFPGWGRLLARRPGLHPWLDRLQRIAWTRPGLADFVVSVWRPKPRADWPDDELRVRRSNPVYRLQAVREAAYWDAKDPAQLFAPPSTRVSEATNRALTGRPDRDWLDDLVARGPFRSAAMLGCDAGAHARRWLEAGASETLDVYDLSPGVLAGARRGLGELAARTRFHRADLNFPELPEAAYDVILSANTLHFLVNLEHLFAAVTRALRPGGLFAFWTYVGEARMRFAPERLARVNALLATVPARYRVVERVEVPRPSERLAETAGSRADEILPLARARFDVVHESLWGRLFPLGLVVDMDAVARDDPSLFDRLMAAEADACADPAMRPCVAWAVYRVRGGARDHAA